MSLRILFASSADISLPLLQTLILDPEIEVVGLICQPDRPSGRGGHLKAPPTKELALKNNIPVYQPESLNLDNETYEKLKNLTFDFLLTFAYGQILSQKILDLARVKSLNIHTSLLPRYRGASPIQASILNGDSETGISLIEMIKRMDAGDIYAKEIVSISGETTADSLYELLSNQAALVVPDWLKRFAELSPVPQNEADATYVQKISKSDGYIDFNESTQQILSKFKAFHPWPGLWTTFNEKRLKLISLEAESLKKNIGEVFSSKSRILVGTKDASVVLHKVQIEGKSIMSAHDFVRGNQDFLGSTLPS